MLKKKISETKNNINDNLDKKKEKIKNFLEKNVYSVKRNEMYQKLLNEYNEQIENEDMKINYDYSLKNYINIVSYIKNNTVKNEKIFINVLEFCFVVAFQSIFILEKAYTINLFLFDNFKGIRKSHLFRELEKIEILKDNKLKDYYNNCPDLDTFDDKKYKYKINYKEIEPLNLFKEYYNKALESIKKMDLF